MCKPHLIDGPADIDLAWFANVNTVLITAGASAPESVVEETVEFCAKILEATVEKRSIREEEVYFPVAEGTSHAGEIEFVDCC